MEKRKKEKDRYEKLKENEVKFDESEILLCSQCKVEKPLSLHKDKIVKQTIIIRQKEPFVKNFSIAIILFLDFHPKE